MKRLRLRHLVLDFNGTLACDGRLHRGVVAKLNSLRRTLALEVLTGDTFGTAGPALRRAGIPYTVISRGTDKAGRVTTLGGAGVVAIGNGRNDVAMFRVAAVSICVLGPEGASPEALAASDIVVPSIAAALDLLLKPTRLIASLRR